jgi:RNA polymerase sigma factor (sigma-70 family)
MVRAEELEQVLDVMSRLNDLAREVIVMRYIEQESYEEIAQRLGKKPQHIRSVSAKAMARLRELLTVREDLSTGRE